jgi:hypothetical protein
MKPSIARRPFTISGTMPPKLMTSVKVGSAAMGAGVGIEAGCCREPLALAIAYSASV